MGNWLARGTGPFNPKVSAIVSWKERFSFFILSIGERFAGGLGPRD